MSGVEFIFHYFLARMITNLFICVFMCLNFLPNSGRAQMLSDVFLVSTHADPQLRGVCATLVGCQLHAQLARDAGCLWSETDATSGRSHS